MSNDTQFIGGLIVKAPHENAPEYVKAKLSIKREELIGWLQQQSGDWINAEVKVSQAGKYYAAVDTWKPDSQKGGTSSARQAPSNPRRDAEPDGIEDDIPFLSMRGKF